MKKQKYLYKVNRIGWICGTLESACDVAFDDIQYTECHTRTLSQPVVTKIPGGYQVTIINDLGQVYKRTIDVFEPDVSKPKRDVIGLAMRARGKWYN